MWIVRDENDKAVAYIADGFYAACFKEVYYQAGRLEYRRVIITVLED
jgi:hypothetical protein